MLGFANINVNLYIDYECLEKNGIQSFLNGIIDGFNDHTIHIGTYFIYLFINYMYQTYNLDVSKYMYNDCKCAFHLSYIFKWNIFNEVCEFIFGFLDYLTNGYWKIQSKLNYLCHFSSINNFTSNYNIFAGEPWKRIIAVSMEFIVGSFVNIMYNIDISWQQQNYYISLNNDINNVDEFDKWYKINIKTGIQDFILSGKNIQFFNSLPDEQKCFYEYIKLYDVPADFDVPFKEIKLNINQYIDCEDAIEFNKGNFTIKNIK